MQLINVYDLRQRDNNNKPMPIEKGNGHICESCGREHGKVFVVADGDKVHEVGSTCCKKLFGWQPTSTQIASLLEAKKLVAWMKKNSKPYDQMASIIRKAFKDETYYFTAMVYDYASRFFGQQEITN